MYVSIFSWQPLWFFLIVVVLTQLLKRFSPFACYILWTCVLLKLIFPIGFIDLSIPMEYVLSAAGTYTPLSFDGLEQSPIPEKVGSAFSEKQAAMASPALDRANDPTTHRNSELFLDPAANPADTITLSDIFLFGWFLISIAVFFHLIYAHISLYFQKKKWLPIKNSKSIHQMLIECCSLFKLKSIPSLHIAGEGSFSPFTTGYTQKGACIVLPHYYDTFNSNTLRMVIAHEISHIKKRDNLFNLFRNCCKVLFHFHPLRYFADKALDETRELCRDLEVVKKLKINQLTYARALSEIYLYTDERLKKQNLLVSSFFGDTICMRRVVFLRDYKDTILAKPSGFMSFFFVFLGFIFNLSLFGITQVDSVLEIPLDSSTYQIPEPQAVHSPLNHSGELIPRFYNDRLWVSEPFEGLYAYRLDDTNKPILVGHYPLPDNQTSSNMRINDFVVYGHYGYAAIGHVDTIFTDTNRVDIYDLSDTSSITKIGRIDQNYPQNLMIVNDTLWIGGMGAYLFQGSVEIYDLKTTPQNPMLLDYDYYEFLPTNIVYNQSMPFVFVFLNDQVLIFDQENLLYPIQTVRLSVTPTYAAIQSENAVILTAMSLDGNAGIGSSSSNYLISLIRDKEDKFHIKHVARFQHEDHSKSFFMYELLPFSDIYWIPLGHVGVAGIQWDLDGFHLSHLIPTKMRKGFVTDETLQFLTPEISIFTKESLNTNPNNYITTWLDHESSL